MCFYVIITFVLWRWFGVRVVLIPSGISDNVQLAIDLLGARMATKTKIGGSS